jgi:hypothetical protein
MAEPESVKGKILQFRRIVDRATEQDGPTEEELAFLRDLRESTREGLHSVRADKDQPR